MIETEMFPTVNLRFIEREETPQVVNNTLKAFSRKVLQQQYVSIDASFNRPKKTEWRDVPLVTGDE